eukprot:jgi/Tetstr1/464577/TSEL_009333.t1
MSVGGSSAVPVADRRELGAARLVELVTGLRGAPPHVVLGVPVDAAPEAVKASYRKHALLLHPDKNSHAHCVEAFKVVSDAFESFERQRKPLAERGGNHPGRSGRDQTNKWEAFTGDPPPDGRYGSASTAAPPAHSGGQGSGSGGGGGGGSCAPPGCGTADGVGVDQEAFQAARAAWGARASRGRAPRAYPAVPPRGAPVAPEPAFAPPPAPASAPPPCWAGAAVPPGGRGNVEQPQPAGSTQRRQGGASAWARPKKRSVLSAFAEEAAAPRSSAPTHRQQQQRHQQRRADPPASPPGSPPDRAGTTAAEEEDGLWGSLYQGFVPGSASESDSHDDFEADDAAARWQTRKPAGEPVPSAQASTRTRARPPSPHP